MQYLQTCCSKINIRINSIGGNVLDGYSIVSSILSSPIPCDCYIDGLAASIAGVVAVAGKKCYMMDYGTLMLHNPSGGNDKQVLSLVKDTLVTIISNRTSKTSEEISEMMNKETWLSASEALNMGLVDEIIESKKKIKVKKESLYNMALVYNKLITNKPTMEKIVNVLKLKNEATEQEIVVAIEEKDTTISNLTTENEALKNKVAEFEAKELEAKEAAAAELKDKATQLVENAIKDGKIEEKDKENSIQNAINDFEFVKNVFSKISTIKNAVKVFDLKKVTNKKGENEDRSEWTIRDWEKKDEKGLAEIKNSNPELYTEMFNSFYKK